MLKNTSSDLKKSCICIFCRWKFVKYRKKNECDKVNGENRIEISQNLESLEKI